MPDETAPTEAGEPVDPLAAGRSLRITMRRDRKVHTGVLRAGDEIAEITLNPGVSLHFVADVLGCGDAEGVPLVVMAIPIPPAIQPLETT